MSLVGFSTKYFIQFYRLLPCIEKCWSGNVLVLQKSLYNFFCLRAAWWDLSYDVALTMCEPSLSALSAKLPQTQTRTVSILEKFRNALKSCTSDKQSFLIAIRF